MVGELANLQSQFSVAYVQAVASVAGFYAEPATRGFDMDGVDVTLLRRGPFGVTESPKLELQVKSHQGVVASDPFPYDLEVSAYEKLRKTAYQVPRVLVVVLVPDDVTQWALHNEDQLLLRRCGYWLSLRGEPSVPNKRQIRVKIPRANLFDPAGVDSLMAIVAGGGNP